jgi:hypothetical protein
MSRTHLHKQLSTCLLAALLLPALPACDDGFDLYRDRVSAATTTLMKYDSCRALETDLKDVLIAEARAQFDQQRYWRSRNGGGLFEATGDAGADSAPAPSSEGPRTAGEDFSTTNNQESGVDEADFVKTDGYQIYTLNGNRLHIFHVPEFGELTPASVRHVEGWPREMLLDAAAKKLVVFSGIDAYSLPAGHPIRAKLERRDGERGDYYWRVANVSKLTVFDVSDPEAPSLVRELYLEGWYSTARLVDSTVRMAAYTSLNVPYLQYYWGFDDIDANEKRTVEAISRMPLTDLVPMIYERSASGLVTQHALTGERCASFHRPTDSHGRGVTSILSLDLLGEQVALDTDQILSNWATIYASKDHLVVAEAAHDWWWFWWSPNDTERTNLHVFDTTRPGKASYVASGRVDGGINDQFSLSDHEGYLRVATTTNRFNWWWWGREDDSQPPPPESHVFVLPIQGGAPLAISGRIDGIAPGESIQSARFDGDRGYLVTFRRIDPFFTLDLADPQLPKVIGELKIPGFATYIHPIANQKILTIGFGGDDTGTNWRTQVSMLDVTNFAAPALVSTLDLAAEGGWAWSEATWEHKAFQYWAPKKLLAIPVSTSTYGVTPTGQYWWRYVSRLELVSVDPEGTPLANYGSIDHSDFFNDDQTYYWTPDVRRSIFMGDYIYAISDRGITVNRTADLASMTRVALPGSRYGEWWWWW